MSHYQNLNIERTLSGSAPPVLAPISTQVTPIAELDLTNRGSSDIFVYDHRSPDIGFPVLAHETFTFSGMTSTQQVSVETSAGNSNYYIRTRRYSKYSSNR